MRIEHVEGENKGKIMLYALSTCGWCRKTKEFLNDLGVEYDYVFVDLLEENDQEQSKKEIMKWNPRCSFPTVVVNDKECIVGYDETKIKEALKL